MYFKGVKTPFRILLSKGPEREVSFKGKQSLSGPAWGAGVSYLGNTKRQYCNRCNFMVKTLSWILYGY